MNPQYNPEQIADIKERELKALETLKELELMPSAQISYVNNGSDQFMTRVQPFLMDTKYAEKTSEAVMDIVADETPSEA